MPKTLYIVDTHAHIFSAYYAPFSGTLTSPDGLPTKATLIFTTMILKLLKERRPDMLVMAMDSPGPTFRHKLYKDYKANRPEMPEDLPPQIASIEEILTAMRIPIVKKQGFEADDLIGAIVTRAVKEKFDIFICSNDKDLEQLIAPGVVLYNLRNGRLLDEKALMENKGIRPDQVTDVLALSGDTVDNIPGIPDVGPKTAQQWIQKYQNLDQLLEHSDQIKGKRGQNLRDHKKRLDLSRQLVTLDCDAPLETDFDEMDLKPFDLPALTNVFKQLGFNKLLLQLQSEFDISTQDDSTAAAELTSPLKTDSTGQTPPAFSFTAHLVNNTADFADFLKKLKAQKSFAIDTETTGLNPLQAQLVGISISWQKEVGYYLPFRAPLGEKTLDLDDALAQLTPILTNPAIKKSGQNIKFDLIVFKQAGIELQGVYFDTMVASYLLDSTRSRHNLDSLAKDYLGHETIHLESLIGKGKKQIGFDQVELQLAAQYAAEDAVVTWNLTQLFDQTLTDPQLRKLFNDVEMPLVEVLSQMEYNGVAVNVKVLNHLRTLMTDKCDQLVKSIHKEAGCQFNVDSPRQLAEVLFDTLRLTPLKKGKTGPSTDQEVLETLRWQHPIPAMMLEYRQLSKLNNTYVEKLPSMICQRTGRIHTSFNQTVAATGRLSSSNPNLQNIPIRSKLGREIRRAFVAQKEGHVLLAADYSQIELRMLAHFSQDPNLLQAFESSQDIHRFVAAQVYGLKPDEVDNDQRDKAKAVNFGIIYGQTPFGLSRSIGIPVEQAKQFIDDYFQRYPKIQEFMHAVVIDAKKNGYVKTILGRRRVIPELNAAARTRQNLAQRLAVNTVIQGSAADLIKVAMVNIHRIIKNDKLDMKMILQVHDELVFEMPQPHAKEYAKIIQHEMIHAIPLNVPITVDVGTGKNWMECK